jgi:hypothetical protein
MIQALTSPHFLLAFVVAPLAAVGWDCLLARLDQRPIRNGTIGC